MCVCCRTSAGSITHEDLIGYAEDAGMPELVPYLGALMGIVDIDGDSAIGFIEFVQFAGRL